MIEILFDNGYISLVSSILAGFALSLGLEITRLYFSSFSRIKNKIKNKFLLTSIIISFIIGILLLATIFVVVGLILYSIFNLKNFLFQGILDLCIIIVTAVCFSLLYKFTRKH